MGNWFRNKLVLWFVVFDSIAHSEPDKTPLWWPPRLEKWVPMITLSPFFLVEYSLHIHSHWWFTKWWYNPTLTLNTDLLDDDSLFHDLRNCNVIFHRYSYDYVYLDSMMSKTWLAPNSMSVTAQPSSLLSSLSATAPCFSDVFTLCISVQIRLQTRPCPGPGLST